MAIPTNPVDKNWPKGPNFLGIVIGAGVALVLLLIVAYFLVRGHSKTLMPTKTNTTPSQTMVVRPSDGLRVS